MTTQTQGTTKQSILEATIAVKGYINTEPKKAPVTGFPTVNPTDDEVAGMITDYKAGMPILKISDKYNWSRGKVKLIVGDTENWI